MSSSILSESLGQLSELVDVDPVTEGSPLRVPLDQVQPDPDQPRTEFDAKALKELAASIEEHGVLQPIAVHPINDDGVYVIKHGERRWRASEIAEGVTDIPVFIDNNSDAYAQMIENIQREDLSPLDIGKWILGRIKQGAEAKTIAKRLGKPDSFVSLHKALPTLPPYIMALYVKNVTRSPRLLVDLQRASRLDEQRTARFCSTALASGATSKKDIDAFLQKLKQNSNKDTSIEQTSNQRQTGQSATSSNTTNKAAQVLIRIGHNENVGELMLDRPSEKGCVWTLFNDSEALMDIDDIRIVAVKTK